MTTGHDSAPTAGRRTQLQSGALAAIIRVGTLSLSLAAVTATYKVLGPANFTIFNLLMFCMALGTAIASPINRAFWASDPRQVFASAVLSTMAIVLLTVLIGMGPALAKGPIFGSVVIVALAIFYAVTRIFERFTYGRVLIEQDVNKALLISFVFALADFLVTATLWSLGEDSLALRLLLPPTLFLIFILLLPYRGHLIEVVKDCGNMRRHGAHMREQILSPVGVRVLILMALATLAGMVDRLILAHMPLRSVQFSADYLLILSYAIALQSLLTISFDLARKCVYREGRWQPNAREFSVRAIAGCLAITSLAIVSYPVMTSLEIIPHSIGIMLWTASLFRALALLSTSLLNVDYFQDGKLKGVMGQNAYIIIVSVIFLYLLFQFDAQLIASLFLIIGCSILMAKQGFDFFRRVPRLSTLQVVSL